MIKSTDQLNINAQIVPLKPDNILGPHPEEHPVFGDWLSCKDGVCQTGDVAHRALSESDAQSKSAYQEISRWLIKHHLSPEKLASIQKRSEIRRKHGLPVPQNLSDGLPRSDKVRKGNLAEIILAEYCCACANANLPVYRLHHSTNVNQSMPGDDVLAFDLDSEPVRVIVGEAKFRSTPGKTAVKDTIDALSRSYGNAVPVSIDFVAACLREQGKTEIADQVDECHVFCENGKAQVDYVGLLVSNSNCAANVDKHGKSNLRRLLLISLSLPDPVGFVQKCWARVDVK